MYESAPSWNMYQAAKGVHEETVEACGAQSPEAVATGVEYARLELICAAETGATVTI
jgi:hypothetical protein